MRLRISHALFHVTGIQNPVRDDGYSHFTDEANEAQRGKVPCLMSRSRAVNPNQ